MKLSILKALSSLRISQKLCWSLFFSSVAFNCQASPNNATCSPSINDGVVVLGKGIYPVWNRAQNSSEKYIIPDAPLSAYRVGKQTCINITHFINGRVCGNSLFDLNHPAKVNYRSPENATFPLFDFHNWLFSPYALNDKTMVALAHSEWYDCSRFPVGSPLSCQVNKNQMNSWSNAVTSYRSNNAGMSWSRTGIVESFNEYPAAFEAIWPNKMINFGFFHPSNIIRDGDRYYSFIRYTKRDPVAANATAYGMILISTADLLSGKWEQVNAEGQYVTEPHGGYVIPGTQNWLMAGVSWNKPMCKYLVMFWDGAKGRIMSTTTPSLAKIEFSEPQEVKNQTSVQIPGSEKLGFGGYNYPVAHLDPYSGSRNFETTGKNFFLFANSFTTKNVLDRNIYRIPASVEDVNSLPEEQKVVVLDAMLFRYNNKYYYSNGAGHYCKMKSMAHLKAKVPNVTISTIRRVYKMPLNMVLDGDC